MRKGATLGGESATGPASKSRFQLIIKRPKVAPSLFPLALSRLRRLEASGSLPPLCACRSLPLPSNATLVKALTTHCYTQPPRLGRPRLCSKCWPLAPTLFYPPLREARPSIQRSHQQTRPPSSRITLSDLYTHTKLLGHVHQAPHPLRPHRLGARSRRPSQPRPALRPARGSRFQGFGRFRLVRGYLHPRLQASRQGRRCVEACSWSREARRLVDAAQEASAWTADARFRDGYAEEVDRQAWWSSALDEAGGRSREAEKGFGARFVAGERGGRVGPRGSR